jgi:hypothetical protein
VTRCSSDFRGKSNELPAVTLDDTKPADAEAAVRPAVDRFGRIDVKPLLLSASHAAGLLTSTGELNGTVRVP